MAKESRDVYMSTYYLNIDKSGGRDEDDQSGSDGNGGGGRPRRPIPGRNPNRRERDRDALREERELQRERRRERDSDPNRQRDKDRDREARRAAATGDITARAQAAGAGGLGVYSNKWLQKAAEIRARVRGKAYNKYYTFQNTGRGPSDFVISKKGGYPLATTAALRQAVKEGKLFTREKDADKGCRGANSIVLKVNGTLSVANNVDNENVDVNKKGEISSITAVMKDRPKGADVIFDIRIGSNSIWSSPTDLPKIRAGEKTTARTIKFPDKVVRNNDNVRLDITQVGSTDPGGGLTVSLTVSEMRNRRGKRSERRRDID